MAVNLMCMWDSQQWEQMYLWLFCLLLGLFSSHWVTWMRSFALSYCILYCPVWLLSLRGLFFSEEEMEGEWREGSCGQGVFLRKECIFNEKNKDLRVSAWPAPSDPPYFLPCPFPSLPWPLSSRYHQDPSSQYPYTRVIIISNTTSSEISLAR